MSYMILGTKLTYEGVKAKQAESEGSYRREKLSLKRALLLVALRPNWIDYDKLTGIASDLWHEDRVEVQLELPHTLHYFNNLQYVQLATKPLDLPSEIIKILGRSHGGIKVKDLLNSLNNVKDYMLPEPIEPAVLAAAQEHPRLGVLRYANDKVFIYIK